MNRSILTSLFVVALSVLFVSGVMAQQTTAPAPTKENLEKFGEKNFEKFLGKKDNFEKFGGKIEKVDPSTKEVVVQGKDKTMTFSVGDKTKIKEGEKEASFSDLKAGERIFVLYAKEGNKLMAEAISIAHTKG